MKALKTIRGNIVVQESKRVSLVETRDGFRRELDQETDSERKKFLEKEIQKANGQIEAAEASLEALRGRLKNQITSIRETIQRVLHEDITLAERVRTLFREQGITIASILTAIGMAVSTLVLALTGGGSTPTPAPKPPTPDKGGIKEWVKKHLQSLGRVLAKLAGKAAGALPGIIGSIVSWLLNLLAKTAGWLAENLWAVVLAFGGLLLVAAREWI